MSLQYAVPPPHGTQPLNADTCPAPGGPALAVRLLGPFEMRCWDDQDRRPAAHKAQELFCYLLLRRGAAVRRDKLTDMLWADDEPDRGRKNLRQALWQLQSSVGRTIARDLLEVTNTAVTFRADADLWVDLIQFRSVSENVADIPGREFSPQVAQRIHDTVRLFHGDLLEDHDFDWCLVEREWVRSTYISLLDKLVAYSEINHQYELGIDYGERILRLDPAREYTHRNLMLLHHLRGDRTGAIRQYTRCIQALHDELAISPADATVRLSELIRADADDLHVTRCYAREDRAG